MIRNTSLVVVTALMFLLPRPAQAEWSLVFADEFNGSTLNTANWGYDLGNGCPNLCGWGNNELQYYRQDNVDLRDGNLVITARRESFSGYQFTSGKITTRDKHSFLYGRFEMRAKLPTGEGTWPAFWMMPQDDAYGGWAASGEIDIMESSNATDYINGTIHYGGSWPNNTYTGRSYSEGGASFANDFRVYAVEWEPDEIRWYVDDVLYSTLASADWFSANAPGNPRAPFDQPFYIILNTAIGGWYTGCTDPGCVTADLPQEYLIDYVRVYQNVPNALPVASFVSPRSGSTLPVGTVTIEVEADDPDGSVERVVFYDGFTELGEDTTAPYTLSWTGVDDGCYTLRARVIDDLGGIEEITSEITVGDGCGQAPFAGGAIALPGRIEAENFDEGGPGVAYQDSDASNNGGAYRPAEQVDIEATSDAGGGFNVGWLEPNEWIEYTIDAPVTGTYSLRARVASFDQGGTFELQLDGSDVAGTVVVPVTGGWQTWVDVDFDVSLQSGRRVLRFIPRSGAFNLNWFETLAVPTSAPGDLARRSIESLDAYPNPFNPQTTIRFDLARASTVELVVFDARGRRVRELAGGESLAGGAHEFRWDGRDDTGQIVAGGVYRARLRADGETRTVQLVLLK